MKKREKMSSLQLAEINLNQLKSLVNKYNTYTELNITPSMTDNLEIIRLTQMLQYNLYEHLKHTQSCQQ